MGAVWAPFLGACTFPELVACLFPLAPCDSSYCFSVLWTHVEGQPFPSWLPSLG